MVTRGGIEPPTRCSWVMLGWVPTWGPATVPSRSKAGVKKSAKVFYEAEAVPLVQAQLARRHPAGSLRRATVKKAPDCVTCFPFRLKVIVAGTTTYAALPVTLA